MDHNEDVQIEFHPNGKKFVNLNSTKRDDSPFYDDVFPDNEIGKLAKGLAVEFLIKLEHRMGWARKSACDDQILLQHPNETVASHMWGVAKLIMVLSRAQMFREELPNFDKAKAIEMALIHDVAELETGDFTPIDKISKEEKHQKEDEAMSKILGNFPNEIAQSLRIVYDTYEDRLTPESKFVKDCDKLDFMINTYVLERKGFGGMVEFYSNTIKSQFYTNIARELANTLFQTRNELLNNNQLYKKKID